MPTFIVSPKKSLAFIEKQKMLFDFLVFDKSNCQFRASKNKNNPANVSENRVTLDLKMALKCRKYI